MKLLCRGSHAYIFRAEPSDGGSLGYFCAYWSYRDDGFVHEGSFECDTPKEIITHAYEHLLQGETFPDHLFEQLDNDVKAQKTPQSFDEHFGR